MGMVTLLMFLHNARILLLGIATEPCTVIIDIGLCPMYIRIAELASVCWWAVSDTIGKG